MAPTDFDIVIVHFHAAAMVHENVASLLRDARESGLAIRIFVADNGSTPEELALLRSLDVTVLDTGGAPGYAAALKFAFPSTSAPYLIVSNEDVMVQPGCLRALHDILANGAGIAGPSFYWDWDRRFMLPPTEDRDRRAELLRMHGRRDARALAKARAAWRAHARRHWVAKEPFESNCLSGAMMAFRRDTAEAVGLMDEAYTLYFEENDWMLRIQASGRSSMYVPQAEAVHLHNPSLAGRADRSEWQANSFLRFGNRFYGEHFMRRLLLLAKRPAFIPEWPPMPEEIELPSDAVWPLWVELTPSPLGYPAATALITDRTQTRWRLLKLRGLEFLSGTFYLQLVDNDGAEISAFSL